ncbi:MAG: GNAT family N-acetyltransferase [Lachnospiraceae bacterium]|nr:GNAT family N-acetyltransferase [Lachnospiraceae bacterium]
MNFKYETERLILAAIDESYADQVCEFYSNNAMDFAKSEPFTEDFYSVEKHRGILEAEVRLFMNGGMFRYWFMLKDEPNKLIGTASLKNFHRGSFMCCEVGYKMDMQYRRKGYCREALEKILSEAEKEENMHRIYATALPDNEPSIGLLESLGFKRVGLIEDYAYINGVWRDHYYFSRVSTLG